MFEVKSKAEKVDRGSLEIRNMRKLALNTILDERVAIVIVESCEPVGESSRKKFDKNFENSLRATVRGTQFETAFRYRQFIA